jgi:hypothetical protein
MVLFSLSLPSAKPSVVANLSLSLVLGRSVLLVLLYCCSSVADAGSFF